jgi:hypothetical protein
MNMAQWLLSIGMKPKPLVRDGLAAPAIKTDAMTTTVWDQEMGGSVEVPMETSKARERPPSERICK